MKSLLALTALLSVTASAFADHTKFVAPRATEAIAAPTREPNAFRPYSRSDARPTGNTTTVTAPTPGASSTPARRVAPYNRSYPRFERASS